MKLRPIDALLRLVYPPLCPACGWKSPLDGHLFCLDCLSEWPETGFHLHAENPFTRHFAGRLPIRTGSAFLFFTHGGSTQRLLHRIKYHQQPDLAVRLGVWYGRQLARAPDWSEVNLIIPVPLQWRRERQRGYNQSERFGAGLAEAMGCPCIPDGLRRNIFRRSLTGMGRFERIRAIESAFQLNRPNILHGRHVLLVDDVLTTGATLEGCALQVLRAGPASLRLATIAMGEL